MKLIVVWNDIPNPTSRDIYSGEWIFYSNCQRREVVAMHPSLNRPYVIKHIMEKFLRKRL